MDNRTNVIIESPKINWENGKENLPTSGKRRKLIPYAYQEAVWKEMSSYYQQPDKYAGLVWIPTGGGKTVIAVHWLYHNAISKGMRVLWLAHRMNLLKQAAETFNSLFDATLLSEEKGLNVVLVSGTSPGTSWRAVAQTDSVVFSTIQTACLETNLESLKLMLTHHQSPNGLYVVVDECHHAQAPSYMKVLNILKEGGAKIIGLTATPFHTDEKKSSRLWKLFQSPDHKGIYRILKKKLIDDKILAEPYPPETVQTKIEQKEIAGDAEITRHNTSDSELKAYVLKRLGENPKRNELIAEHYKKNAEKYQKTIIFTPETMANKFLVQELKKKGIEADYVDTYRTNEENQKVMERFRTDDSLQVLVNTEMCTEGFDAPKTKTVFIARPTRSETLVQQMVGRAMRGIEAGGNEKCYLVTFADTWKDFTPIDPAVVVSQAENDDLEIQKKYYQSTIPIPPEVIEECYKLLHNLQIGELLSCTIEGIPYAWYEWDAPENAEDETLSDKEKVIIFETQKEGYEKLENDVKNGLLSLPEIISDPFVNSIRNKYFEVCLDPVPRPEDLKKILSAWKNSERTEDISKITFEQRDKFDTRKIAKEIIDEDLTDSKQQEKINSLWDDPVCQLLFNKNRQGFVEDINRKKELLRDRQNITRELIRLKPDIQKQELKKWNAGDSGFILKEILETVGNNKKLFPKGKLNIREPLFTKMSNRFFGICNYTDGNKIQISDILNSPSVPLAVMEFLMYHEMLHAAGYHRHNGVFREKERLFVPSEKAMEDAKKFPEWSDTLKNSKIPWQALCDQFLDTFYLRFENKMDKGEF
ncbi:MAG TPA: DEAD/DEAH box helicase [Leptospiraceae bacterium]|nr:DEAD/DEAH box helicase [Leptospiraceae bacterium]